jgi:type I restriction enzyme M protein
VPELYSEQDAETKVVVPALVKLGYDENDANRRVVLRFREPIPVHQGREQRTITADIVVHVHGEPLIVIDAKNPRDLLTDNDREQVISYARLVGNVAPYSVLSNGIAWRYFDTITKQEIKGIPSYDDLVRDMTRRRLTPRQRDSLKDQATRTVFAIESARELSRLMRRCHDVIRNQKGYDPTKAFDELSKLLFAKMFEERQLAEGYRTENRFAWDVVRRMRENGVEIIQVLWRDTINSERYQEVFSDADGMSEIELPPAAIDQVVKILEDKSLGQTDLDVKGIAFEEFLASTFRGGGLGQYFTPREVVNFMVDLVDPAIGEKCIDPACGTGGFLIRAYDVVSEKIRNSELSARDKQDRLQQLASSCLVGIDWESRAARTCKMNMIIHGDGHAGIYQAHALDVADLDRKVRDRQRIYSQAPGIEEGTFDIVLTNPPFGASDQRNETFSRYELMRRSQKREVLFIERCLRLLKPGGRMAIVIPEGILSNKNDRYVRNLMRREAIIKAVIRLPQDAFQMSEGAACTSLLFVVKKDPDDPALLEQGDIFYARAEYIGISPSGKPISQNDLLAIKEHYQRFVEGRWDGIELKALGGGRMELVRAAPSDERGLWLEPTKNRTSLLYDRLSYVVRSPCIEDRFGYTFDHPEYHRIANALDAMPVEVTTVDSLCVEGYPIRGKKPSEESVEGIPLI